MTETQLTVRDVPAEDVAEEALSGPERRDDRISVVKPASGRPTLDLRELWAYRELLVIFVWRDVKVRYKQTFLGITWAVLQPLVTMLVYTLVFGRYAEFPSQNLAYPIFTYVALLPWGYFAASLSGSSGSIVGNRAVMTKVYFPRVLLPLAAVVTPAVDFTLAFLVGFGLMAYFDVWPSITLLLTPLFLLLAAVAAVGVGFFLSAVNVRYRDVPYLIPFFLSIGPFLSGVMYPIADLPEHWQWVLALNPMTGVIAGFRWALLDAPAPDLGQLAVGIAVAVAVFVVGLAYFKRSEPRFADTI